MDLSAQKEQFSIAYVEAVVAVAGFGSARPTPDDDSIDLAVLASGGFGSGIRPRLELQLKATATVPPEQDPIQFSLSAKNYDDLRADVIVPRILVVVTLPRDLARWLDQSEQEMALRHCGYWLSLHGMPPLNGAASKTVHLPRTRRFSPSALLTIMNHVSRREPL